jgi:hypothetical protein
LSVAARARPNRSSDLITTCTTKTTIDAMHEDDDVKDVK